MDLRVPFATLIKIALAVLLAAIIVKLWPVILMIIIAVLIAVMLDPLVVWLEEHGSRRGFGITLVTAGLLGLLTLFLAFLLPAMSRQVSDLLPQLPSILHRLASRFPSIAPFIAGLRSDPRSFLASGMTLIQGVTAAIFVLVVAVYLLVEGRRAYAWLVSFVPARNRRRVDRTGREISRVIHSYMRGSMITATICGLYVAVVLTTLHIPMALVLAVLAFFFDFIPVIGTILMMIPSTLLALLISPGRALVVAAAYLLYHVIEAYVLIPRIWGQHMRVSTLTVVLAMAVGGTLQGAIGAVLALPIAAAYPIVERIWLREHLPPDTVPRHEALVEDSGSPLS